MIDPAKLLTEIADVLMFIASGIVVFLYRKVTKMEEDIYNRMTKEQVDKRIDEKLALMHQSIEYIKSCLGTITEIKVRQSRD